MVINDKDGGFFHGVLDVNFVMVSERIFFDAQVTHQKDVRLTFKNEGKKDPFFPDL